MKANEPRIKYRDKEYTSLDKAEIRFFKGKKVTYSVNLKPSEASRLFADIKRVERNPLKISFGVIKKGDNRLEICAYKVASQPDPNTLPPNYRDLSKKFIVTTPQKWLIFLNGEHIALEKENWRSVNRIMCKLGHYLGILGRKRRKNG